MAFLVIPNEVESNSATVWLAAINESFDPAHAVLEYGSNQMGLHRMWGDYSTSDGKNRILYLRVKLTELSPRTPYNLTFRFQGQVKADGRVTTLPDRLPNAGERPFTVLLGSCYFQREDKMGAVGQTFSQFPHDAQPDIKILCGDQVYLDNPPQDFVFPRGKEWLENRSFKVYTDTWSQLTDAGGFQRLLKNNANYFSSDDHEFWNNAPDRGLNVPTMTATQGQRDTWMRVGRDLYKIFQTEPSPPKTLKVGPLSFCVAETRFSRGSGGGAGDFMPAQDLEFVRNWISNLDGPGALVVGQPLFAGKGSIKDWGLADFRQYSLLIQFLKASQHSIVILTGDVHFGRIAMANLRPELGTKLIEVISSPMQLVPLGGGDYEAAPDVFGSVGSQPEFSLKRNHFLTLEFTSPSAQRASMLVRFWPIIKEGVQAPSQVIGGGAFELI